MLKKVRDPLSVFLVGFLALDGLDELWVADDNVTGILEYVVYVEPVFSRRLHANVFTTVVAQPTLKNAQAAGIGGKPTGLILCHPDTAGGSNAGD